LHNADIPGFDSSLKEDLASVSHVSDQQAVDCDLALTNNELFLTVETWMPGLSPQASKLKEAARPVDEPPVPK
jgi:hypothetical protein